MNTSILSCARVKIELVTYVESLPSCARRTGMGIGKLVGSNNHLLSMVHGLLLLVRPAVPVSEGAYG
jgi:hypothetical protein|uniref:Uncharacterized protein n=1 Tax=Picea glauca TaxID=3330 RepID=A0A101LUL5_PICGL|nr:hypothetical protein ABT39_MTgene2437 [Picea glauca]QHR86795.1 hypothetical protein Q903MT_gene800 [Picea sitchensis]